MRPALVTVLFVGAATIAALSTRAQRDAAADVGRPSEG
jgi:hypothetical protein